MVSNQRLRDQLRASQETNQRLMDNVRELTFRWRESQGKLEEREKSWQEKMDTQSSKLTQSHRDSLLAFFKDVAEVKDHFSRVVASIQKYVKHKAEDQL